MEPEVQKTIVKELSERFRVAEDVIEVAVGHSSKAAFIDESTRQLKIKLMSAPGTIWTLGERAHEKSIYQSMSQKADLVIKDMHYTHLANVVNKMERDGITKAMPFTYLVMKSELLYRDEHMKIQPGMAVPATTQASPLGKVAVGAPGTFHPTGKKLTDHLIGLEKHAKMLISAMRLGMPSLLIGETGTGKTSLAKVLGEVTLGKKVVRINLDGGCTPDEIIGRYQLKGTETVFELGIIPQAMKEGSVVILDEINAALPDTLFALHPVLEENPRLLITETGEDIKPAPGFCVVATMNPSHEYAGTKQLNAALYSRFGMVLRFDTLKGDKLLRALTLHIPTAPAASVTRIALIMETVERLRGDDKVNTRITIREGIAALQLSMDGLSIEEAIEASISGKLEAYELKEVSATGVLKASLHAGHSLGSMSITEVLEKASTAVKLEREVLKLQKEIKAYSKLADVLKSMASGPEGKEEAPSAASGSGAGEVAATPSTTTPEPATSSAS